MKLLAGSLDVEVDAFLHAGYLSAGGRSFDRMGRYEFEGATTTLIDVTKSLELKDTAAPTHQTTQSTANESPPRAPVPVRASLSGGGFVVGAVLLFFGVLAILYARRLPAGSQPRWMTQLFIGLPLILTAVITMGVGGVLPQYESHRLNNLPPPWAGLPRQEYKDPAAATETIMHALVANALPGSPINVEQLGAIRHEVVFPLPVERWTPGMAYAAKTYGLDGWGREFAFQPFTAGRYRIASAGPDGEHGTGDDSVLFTSRTEEDDWEQLVNGIYARQVDGVYAYFVHRVAHGNYRSQRPRDARKTTGTSVFDKLGAGSLVSWQEKGVEQNALVAQLDSHRLNDEGVANPNSLFFVRIARADDG